MIGIRSARTGMLAIVLLFSTVAGCNPPPPVAELPPPPVSVSQPIVREIVDYDEYEGRISALKMVEIRARVRGHLMKVLFEDGQMVKEGDLLFELDPRPFQSQLDIAAAQVKQAEAQLGFKKNDLARYTVVAKTPGAVSQQQLDLAESAVHEAEATLLANKANMEAAKLNLDYTRITAPISGKISRSQVDIGNLINAGGGDTLLTTIVTVNPMYVYFNVDERSLLRYRKEAPTAGNDAKPQPTIKELKIPVQVSLEGEEGYPHKGMLDFADNRVNPSTGTIQARGVIPNPRQLLDSGMRARVRISLSDPHKALMIDERALGTDQGRRFVYVVNSQNLVERRDVKLDRLVEGMVVIKTGLKPEELVVVNGIQRVRDGMKVEPHRVPMPGVQAAAESNPGTSKN